MAEALREIDAGRLSADRFHDEILPAAQPLVLRGLVADWPVVRAARQGPATLADYLRRWDSGRAVNVKIAPPKVRGRFFYNDDLSGFNFRKETMTVSAALDRLAASSAEALSIQSIQSLQLLPGFDRENPLQILPESAVPRLWLGNAGTVAAHYDPADNIACVGAGRRRFTLFAPDQVGNLYPGPFERTIAGPIVSMVDFDAPDLVLFPRFPAAMATALVAELEPGDAIFIPCMWWHHVQSTAPLNLLVNYWLEKPSSAHALGIDAMQHAMLAIKGLPKPHRDAWRSLFSHYVFQDDGAPGTHLPEGSRGIQGELTPTAAQTLREKLGRSLSPDQARRSFRQRLWRLVDRSRHVMRPK